MSSSIGQHMASMFDECFEHLNQLITFCHVFIKLKDVTTSKAFKVSIIYQLILTSNVLLGI